MKIERENLKELNASVLVWAEKNLTKLLNYFGKKRGENRNYQTVYIQHTCICRKKYACKKRSKLSKNLDSNIENCWCTNSTLQLYKSTRNKRLAAHMGNNHMWNPIETESDRERTKTHTHRKQSYIICTQNRVEV